MAEIWAAAAVVGGAAISAYGASKDAKSKNKGDKEQSQLDFQRELFLRERDRKYSLQDRQYTEDNIAGFRQFATDEDRMFNGQEVAHPTRTSTEGLAEFDPNIKGSSNIKGGTNKKPLLNSGAN